VGYLETNKSLYFFATNVEMENVTMDNFPDIRMNANKEAFKKLKMIER